MRYILDPQNVYGPDFPGETFRIPKTAVAPWLHSPPFRLPG